MAESISSSVRTAHDPAVIQRWAEYLGEARANLVRVILFPAILLWVAALREDTSTRGDLWPRLTIDVWARPVLLLLAMFVFVVCLCLRHRFFYPLLKYIFTAADLSLLTLIIILSREPDHLGIFGYHFVIIMAALRRSQPLIIVTTVAAAFIVMLTPSVMAGLDFYSGSAFYPKHLIYAGAIVPVAAIAMYISRRSLEATVNELEPSDKERVPKNALKPSPHCTCGALISETALHCWLCQRSSAIAGSPPHVRLIAFAEAIQKEVTIGIVVAAVLMFVPALLVAAETGGVSIILYGVAVALLIPAEDKMSALARLIYTLMSIVVIALLAGLALAILGAIVCFLFTAVTGT